MSLTNLKLKCDYFPPWFLLRRTALRWMNWFVTRKYFLVLKLCQTPDNVKSFVNTKSYLCKTVGKNATRNIHVTFYQVCKKCDFFDGLCLTIAMLSIGDSWQKHLWKWHTGSMDFNTLSLGNPTGNLIQRTTNILKI